MVRSLGCLFTQEHKHSGTFERRRVLVFIVDKKSIMLSDMIGVFSFAALYESISIINGKGIDPPCNV